MSKWPRGAEPFCQRRWDVRTVRRGWRASLSVVAKAAAAGTALGGAQSRRSEARGRRERRAHRSRSERTGSSDGNATGARHTCRPGPIAGSGGPKRRHTSTPSHALPLRDGVVRRVHGGRAGRPCTRGVPPHPNVDPATAADSVSRGQPVARKRHQRGAPPASYATTAVAPIRCGPGKGNKSCARPLPRALRGPRALCASRRAAGAARRSAMNEVSTIVASTSRATTWLRGSRDRAARSLGGARRTARSAEAAAPARALRPHQ